MRALWQAAGHSFSLPTNTHIKTRTMYAWNTLVAPRQKKHTRRQKHQRKISHSFGWCGETAEDLPSSADGDRLGK